MDCIALASPTRRLTRYVAERPTRTAAQPTAADARLVESYYVLTDLYNETPHP
jgi:hypothetical protein